MTQIIIFIQLVFVTLAVAQEQSTSAAVSCSCDVSNYSFANQPVFPTCMFWSYSVFRRDDYTYTPGIGAHKLHTRPLGWNQARWMCEDEGGHLAIVNSIAEGDAIKQLFDQAEALSPGIDLHQAYIGFHDLFQEGEYVTVYGQSLTKAGFTRWAPGEPNNGRGIEDCGTILRAGIKMNDVDCSETYPYICELPV